MFIMIFEDGTKWTSNDISEIDWESVKEGIVEIIDVSDPNNLKEFYDGEWRKLKGSEELIRR